MRLTSGKDRHLQSWRFVLALVDWLAMSNLASQIYVLAARPFQVLYPLLPSLERKKK
jgi:hypothetical protein